MVYSLHSLGTEFDNKKDQVEGKVLTLEKTHKSFKKSG